MPDAEPAPLPASPYPLTFQSEADFKANWDRQALSARGSMIRRRLPRSWSIMIKTDPEGAKWGPGGRLSAGDATGASARPSPPRSRRRC